MATKVKDISPKVKEILSNLSWDFKSGTVNSLDVIEKLEQDKTLGLLVKVNNLNKIKHRPISVDSLIENSLIEAQSLKSSRMETLHLFMGVLKTLGSKKYSSVKNQIHEILAVPKAKKPTKHYRWAIDKPEKEPNLSPYIKNLTKLASQGKLKPVVSHPEVEDRVLSILHRKYKNSVLLVGNKGSGKTSTLLSLAHRIHQGDVPKKLKGANLISINLSGLLHSIDAREKLDQTLRDQIHQAGDKNGFTIFFFDDLHLLSSIGMFGFSPPLGDQYESTHENTLGPFSNVAFIATINGDHGDRIFEAPILDLWETFKLPQANQVHLKNILKFKATDLYHHFGILIKQKSLDYIANNINDVSLSTKSLTEASTSNIHDAVTILDDIFASFSSKYGHRLPLKPSVKAKSPSGTMSSAELLEYTKDDKVIQNIYAITIPHSFVLNHLKDYYLGINTQSIVSLKTLKSLDEKMAKNIIGQNEAIHSLVRSVKRSVLGLTNPKKPLSSLLFLGPTGVGKTETAKQLSKYLYGKNSLIRIDMSDFMEKHTVARLVGSPPGYVGYGEGGQLTNFVAENPNCVVLFDEIEKAHNDVLNILLQILEEGEITTGEGETVSFKKCVVILTSNIGVDLLQKIPIGFVNSGFDVEHQKMKETLMSNLKKKVKPEILNRLNDIVVFKTLSTKDAKKIVEINVEQLQQQIKKQHGIKLSIDQGVHKHLLKKGYSKEYGAREIKRSIEKNLVDIVVDRIIDEGPGKKTLRVVKKGERLVVSSD